MIRGQFGAQVDLIFSALFVIDIACRFFIEGRRFFFGPGARWILFFAIGVRWSFGMLSDVAGGRHCSPCLAAFDGFMSRQVYVYD